MSNTDLNTVHRRLILNTGSNVARHLLTMLIQLVLFRFVIQTLGDSLYGFWVLVASFIGYANLLELSITPAVVKLVAQYDAVEDSAKLEELILAAGSYFLGIGALAAVFLMGAAPFIVANISDLGELEHGRLLFAGIGLDAILLYMNYLFTGILYGRQKYHIKNVIDLSCLLLYAVLVWNFLPRGGLLALVGAKLTQDTFVFVSSFLAARRVLPGLRLRPKLVERGSYRELFSFGGRVFVSGITTRMATLAQPLIISTAISAAANTIYTIPLRLRDPVRQLAWTLGSAFMPMFSELESRKEHAALRKIYLGYTRYLFLILQAAAIFLFLYGGPFIARYLGPDYRERSQAVLYLMAATLFVESFHPILWRLFIGVSELNVLVKVSAISSLLVVAMSAVLVRFFGIEGVAFSVLFGAVLAQSIYALRACRYLEISPLSMFAEVHLRPLLVGASCFVATAFLQTRLGSGDYFRILLGCLAGLLLYALLAWPFALTGNERARVLTRLPGAKRSVRESAP